MSDTLSVLKRIRNIRFICENARTISRNVQYDSNCAVIRFFIFFAFAWPVPSVLHLFAGVVANV
jgi:hypothetical protein